MHCTHFVHEVGCYLRSCDIFAAIETSKILMVVYTLNSSCFENNVVMSKILIQVKGARTPEVQTPPAHAHTYFLGKNNSYSIICKPFLLSRA